MKITKCDKCKKELKNERIMTIYSPQTTPRNNDEFSWDLCKECFQEIKKFVKKYEK